MSVFLDTSALVKLYHQERGSLFLAGLAASRSRIIISRLGVVEAHSALAMKVRTGALRDEEAIVARRRLISDMRRRFRVVALPIRHYDLAQQLIAALGVSHSLRTLDAIQLATAIDLARAGVIRTFVTADRYLIRAAAEAQSRGMSPVFDCVDPEAEPVVPE